MTSTTTEVRMPGTPAPVMNAAMSAMLRIPGLRSVLGRGFAIITVTGARTAKRYSTPVQYLEIDGRYVVLSQTHRIWWRNLRTRPEVELLVCGTAIRGTATVLEGVDGRELLTTCLEKAPRVAGFYGIEPPIDTTSVDRLLEHVVVIEIRPAP